MCQFFSLIIIQQVEDKYAQIDRPKNTTQLYPGERYKQVVLTLFLPSEDPQKTQTYQTQSWDNKRTLWQNKWEKSSQ